MKLTHVVIAGGVGSRLWPLSRKAHPKQFLSIANDRSMISDTFLRYKNINFSNQLVICNKDHKFLVNDTLAECDLKADTILEPVGRNTAPAAMLASIYVTNSDDDGIILLSPSDHAIKHINGLEKAIEKSISLAEQGMIVTFGISPKYPETGYGYIKTGASIDNVPDLYNIDLFAEKPNHDQAVKYVDDGNYLWNSGIFLFKASTMIEKMKEYRPDIASSCEDAYSRSLTDTKKDGTIFVDIDDESFVSCASESIDYAIMENISNGVVAKLDVDWSDLGSWQSIWDFKDKDSFGNACDGDVWLKDTQNCLIKSESKHFIAAIGIENLTIIQTADALLVADLSRSQEVKTVVEMLKDESRSEYLNHREVHRPWGQYDSIDSNSRYQVKRITVKPGEKLSVQMHYHRAEHWIVVGGTALVRKGHDKDNLVEHLLRENESIYIEIGEIHTLENPGKVPLDLIEVQSGAYLGEDDIVRFSDVYGRDKTS